MDCVDLLRTAGMLSDSYLNIIRMVQVGSSNSMTVLHAFCTQRTTRPTSNRYREFPR